MKKNLGLVSSFTLLTTGITPLMAMMPNNNNPESSNRRNQVINDQINEGENKVLKDNLFHDDNNNFYLEEWAIYLSNKSIRDIKIIFNQRSQNSIINIQQLINYILIKLRETGGNDELLFVSKMNPQHQFYNIFFNSIINIFSNPLINSNKGIILLINTNGEIKNVFSQ
ncbi:hypothetical protein [Spiroplasma phoeniceum]|uniref:Spiroplasma plectrovirus-related protein n=1 Tax=Spiroplasma phoeniceum P40 TaxID=1276259 RepID=A0A345DMQ3_9MOLU|nr:hypothetical protein [Spiroplasma phoeniceum]AXF95491.1 hypothetical protein SDAV_00497 [Spiroplasma phoeniceum P40]